MLTAREAQQLHLLEQWGRLSPSQREIRRQQVRDRERMPLTHRGDWRIRDTKATPLNLDPIPNSVEHFGTWGYRAS